MCGVRVKMRDKPSSNFHANRGLARAYTQKFSWII